MPDDLRPGLAYPPSDAPAIDLRGVVSVHDFEAPARERLHPAAWAYYEGGAWDGHTLRANATAWDRFRLRPRVLVDVSQVTLETTILGRPAVAAHRCRAGRAPRPCASGRRARHRARGGRRRRDQRRVHRRVAVHRGDRRRSPRRPPLVPALRPARLGRDPRPRGAGGRRRLRGARPHRGRAGPGLPRRHPPAHLRPGRGCLREPAQARRVAPRRRAGRDPGHARRAADLGHARRDPLLGAAAAGPQGDPHGRGRPPRGRSRCGRRLGVATTAAASWTGPRRASRCSRRSSTPSRAGRRSTSTAGSGAGRTSSSRSRSARPRSSPRGRSCTPWPVPARRVWRMPSRIYRDEMDRALAIAGVARPSALHRDHVRVVSSDR